MSLNNVIKTANTSRNALKDFKKVFGIGKTLTKKEIKDIMKEIKSLEKEIILLKGTATKII